MWRNEMHFGLHQCPLQNRNCHLSVRKVQGCARAYVWKCAYVRVWRCYCATESSVRSDVCAFKKKLSIWGILVVLYLGVSVFTVQPACNIHAVPCSTYTINSAWGSSIHGLDSGCILCITYKALFVTTVLWCGAYAWAADSIHWPNAALIQHTDGAY